MRIDYYPSRRAAAVIRHLLQGIGVGGNYTGILDAIIKEWADLSGIK